MAEKRVKSARILLRFCGNNTENNAENIELFPAEQWKAGAKGYFRLRIGGKFRDAPDGSNAYASPEEVGKLVAAALAGGFNVPVREKMPRIPANTPVRVVVGTLAGQPLCVRTRTCAPPHRGKDGRCMIWVYIPDEGYREVHWSDVQAERPRPLRKHQRDYFDTMDSQEESPCNGYSR